MGRIVTAAAALLTVTLFSFSIGPSFMKMFGIGTGLAILIDATLVRGVLVPAFMRVAGDLNWWAPRPLTADAWGDRTVCGEGDRMRTSRRAHRRPGGSPGFGRCRLRGPLNGNLRARARSGDGAAAFIAVNPGTEHEALVPIHGWLFVGRMCDGLDEYHRLLVDDPDMSRDHLEIGVNVEQSRA